MKMIHKQTLPWDANDEVTIFVPVHSHHLDVQMQDNDICVWYVCDPDESINEKLVFRIVGTGWELPDDFINKHFWIKTIQHDGYIWHIFLKQQTASVEITS